MNRKSFIRLLAAAVVFPVVLAAATQAVGDKAPGFSLESIDDHTVPLSDVTAQGTTALVVLRGYPG